MSQTLRKRNAKTFMDWVLGRVMEDHPRYPAVGVCHQAACLVPAWFRDGSAA